MRRVVSLRQLDLRQSDDFDCLRVHIGLLYAELFGEGLVPSEACFDALAEQIRDRGPAHWAFLGTAPDQKPIAFATLAESFAVFAEGAYGIINELWVHRDHRSRGVGARVLEHCRQFGLHRGWRRIDVSAPAMAKWDRTFAFYQNHGFELTGRKLKIRLK